MGLKALETQIKNSNKLLKELITVTQKTKTVLTMVNVVNIVTLIAIVLLMVVKYG